MTEGLSPEAIKAIYPDIKTDNILKDAAEELGLDWAEWQVLEDEAFKTLYEVEVEDVDDADVD